MTILEKIATDIKSAMKAKEKEKLTAVKNVKTSLIKYTKDHSIAEPTDADLVPVIEKFIAERKKTIETYEAIKDVDVSDKVNAEKLEIELAIGYLLEDLQTIYNAKPLTIEELEEVVKKTVTVNEWTSMKDMGDAMRILGTSLKGKAEKKDISQIVRKLLS